MKSGLYQGSIAWNNTDDSSSLAINGTGSLTAIGGYMGAGIGGGSRGSTENIQITNGSVKANSIGTTPTDGNGNNVYLARLENQDGINQATVDSRANQKIFTRAGNHPDGDTAFYLYLTGQDHVVASKGTHYKAVWNGSDGFKWKVSALTVEIAGTTASSITVNPLDNQATYGMAEYSINGTDWQENNLFTNLSVGKSYTVYARYKGKGSYLPSETGELESVLTNAASWKIRTA